MATSRQSSTASTILRSVYAAMPGIIIPGVELGIIFCIMFSLFCSSGEEHPPCFMAVVLTMIFQVIYLLLTITDFYLYLVLCPPYQLEQLPHARLLPVHQDPEAVDARRDHRAEVDGHDHQY